MILSALAVGFFVGAAAAVVDFPAPGFIVGASDGVVALKVFSKTNSPIHCDELTFNNWDGDTRPFVLMEDTEANGRSVWHNGEYFLSFVTVAGDSSAPHGTWIVGKHPGEDSGVANLKPQGTTYVPAGLEGERTRWSVLRNRVWEQVDGMTLNCSRGRVGSHYYSVQHPGSEFSTLMAETRLLDLSEGVHPPRKAKSQTLSFSFGSTISPTSYSYWHNHDQKWVSFKSSDAVGFSRGMPVRLRTVARGLIADPALLLTDESINQGWALYFRHTDLGGEVERRIEIGPTGVLHGAGVEALSPSDRAATQKKNHKDLLGARRGDYMWAWLRVGGGAVEPYMLRCEASSQQFAGGTPSAVAVFSYHNSHRRHIMERSVLDRHTQRLVIRADPGHNVGGVTVDGATQLGAHVNGAPVISMNGSPVLLVGLVRVGPDPVSWLQDHLNAHDGVLASDIPACFFYHGGMTLPEPFVYAAEILCVLMGAKPLSMIQYTTPSDLQWKFPLVSELIEAVLVVEELTPSLGDSEGSTMRYEQFKYGRDETLVLYNAAEKDRVDMLLPYHTAQALHIVPYPPAETEFGIESVHAAHEEQVYNSYFNGMILGYPQRFVETYCKDLPNKLNEGQLRRALSRGKDAVSRAVSSGAVDTAQMHIRINRTAGISDTKWNFIKHYVMTL